MLLGEAYRTVRNYSVNAEGDSYDLSYSKIKAGAEYVIRYINGDRSKSRRKVGLPISDDAVDRIIGDCQGLIECYGDLPKTVGQISRFGIVWWATDDNYKYIRFFGDRIHLNYPHPAPPRLFSFGEQPYHLLFQCDDPFHCLKCRKTLRMGEGRWRNNSFICDACLYEQETGFRQGLDKLRKKRAR